MPKLWNFKCRQLWNLVYRLQKMRKSPAIIAISVKEALINAKEELGLASVEAVNGYCNLFVDRAKYIEKAFKKVGVEVTDIAKRLIDYGFHAPTVSFPVAGTLMVEPTESETKAELDRFCDALISIRKEIDEVANGDYPVDNNVLHNAPHPQHLLTADEWEYPYTRSKAAFPLEWVRERKFFATVARIDDAYGDRNLMCTCAPVESYIEE